MGSKYLKLNRLSPLILRDGKILRNRIVIPAMASETADEYGNVTEETLEHYRRLTQSHAGMVMVEYSFVHASGKSEPHQLGITNDSQIEGLSKIAHLIRESGSVSILQLTHAGGKSSTDLTGGMLFAPSQIPVPVKDRSMEIPAEMSKVDIDLWKDAFLNGARSRYGNSNRYNRISQSNLGPDVGSNWR